MARLAFKVSIKHALSNFIGLADAYDTSVEQGLRDTAEHVKDLITANYTLASVAPQHPLTLARKSFEGYQKVDLLNRITEDFDDRGDLRVGFFDQPRDIMRIIYQQEFGGSIPITDKMREWYNTMAYISQGWQPKDKDGNEIPTPTPPSAFPYPFPPLKDSTTAMKIPAKFFLRDAFSTIGNANILANRIARGLDAFMTGRFVGGNNVTQNFL